MERHYGIISRVQVRLDSGIPGKVLVHEIEIGLLLQDWKYCERVLREGQQGHA
jgi:hypothetical protein